MDALFDLCVEFLEWLAPIVGMTYKEVNIWIFVIIEPIVFIILLAVIIWQRKMNKKYKYNLE